MFTGFSVCKWGHPIVFSENLMIVAGGTETVFIGDIRHTYVRGKERCETFP